MTDPQSLSINDASHESEDTEELEESFDVIESPKPVLKIRITNRSSGSNTTEEEPADPVTAPPPVPSFNTTIPAHIDFTEELKLLTKTSAFPYSKEDIELGFTPGYIDNQYFFSLYKNDELIITATMETHDDFMFISYVSTQESYRRRGIGYRFLKFIFHTLYLTLNIKRVYLIARNLMKEDGKWYKVKESPVYRFWEKLDFHRIAWKNFPHIPNVLEKGGVLANARAYRLELVDVYHCSEDLRQVKNYPVIEKLFKELHPPCTNDDFTENTFKIRCMMPNIAKSTTMEWPPFPEAIIQKELEIRKKLEPKAQVHHNQQVYPSNMMMMSAMQRQAMMMGHPMQQAHVNVQNNNQVGNVDAINYRAMMQQQYYEQQMYLQQYQLQQYMYMQQMHQIAAMRLMEEQRRKIVRQQQAAQQAKLQAAAAHENNKKTNNNTDNNINDIIRDPEESNDKTNTVIPKLPISITIPKKDNQENNIHIPSTIPRSFPPAIKPISEPASNSDLFSFPKETKPSQTTLPSPEMVPHANTIKPPSPEVLPQVVNKSPSNQMPQIDLFSTLPRKRKFDDM